jgi:hypothetical protein
MHAHKRGFYRVRDVKHNNSCVCASVVHWSDGTKALLASCNVEQNEKHAIRKTQSLRGERTCIPDVKRDYTTIVNLDVLREEGGCFGHAKHKKKTRKSKFREHRRTANVETKCLPPIVGGVFELSIPLTK